MSSPGITIHADVVTRTGLKVEREEEEEEMDEVTIGEDDVINDDEVVVANVSLSSASIDGDGEGIRALVLLLLDGVNTSSVLMATLDVADIATTVDTLEDDVI